MTPSSYRLVFRLDSEQTRFGAGRLVFYGTTPWLYPDRNLLDREPMLAGAVELDPAFLQSQIDSDSGERFYFYTGEIHVPQ